DPPGMAEPRSFFHPDCHGRLRSHTGSARNGARNPVCRSLKAASARGLYRRWGLRTPPRRKRRPGRIAARTLGGQNSGRGTSFGAPRFAGGLFGIRRTAKAVERRAVLADSHLRDPHLKSRQWTTSFPRARRLGSAAHIVNAKVRGRLRLVVEPQADRVVR